MNTNSFEFIKFVKHFCVIYVLAYAWICFDNLASRIQKNAILSLMSTMSNMIFNQMKNFIKFLNDLIDFLTLMFWEHF